MFKFVKKVFKKVFKKFHRKSRGSTLGPPSGRADAQLMVPEEQAMMEETSRTMINGDEDGGLAAVSVDAVGIEQAAETTQNAAIDWKGTAKVTWSGIEMLLKGAEKFLEGTPFSTPVAVINTLVEVIHNVSDNREDMCDMISQIQKRLETINTALVQSEVANERTNEFAKVLITQITKLHEMASRSFLKRTLTSDDDIRELKRVFQELEASTKDFHLTISLNIERNSFAILSSVEQHRLESLPRSRQARYDADVDSEAVGVTRGACTPGTRVEIIQRLVEWARKQSSEKSASVYWLNGSAGTGKSTIAYSVCKSLDAEDPNILGASFFCSRQLAELRERKCIIPSIVHQLALYSRSFATALLKANLASVDSSAKHMKDLLVEPWQNSASSRLPDFPPCLIVVDALDEARDGWEFLSELISTVEAGHLKGLKFLITSRREPKLVERCTALTSDFVCQLEEVTKNNIQHDILTFLSAELSNLSGTPQLKDLAERADGLFVYAATAARFISCGYPEERLPQLIRLLEAWPTRSDSIDELHVDQLYSQVLQDVFTSAGEVRRHRRLKILHIILCTEEPVSISVLSGLTCDSECSVDFVNRVIDDLHAVLYVSKHDGRIFWYHKSFYDFMCDSERSLAYTCNIVAQHALLAQGCFTIMKRDLRFNICDLPSSFLLDSEVSDLTERINKYITPLRPLLDYVCYHWAEHLDYGLRDVTVHAEVLTHLRAFCDDKLLFWIEIMNIISHEGECLTALRIACEALKVQCETENKVATVLLNDLKDAWNFATAFITNTLAASTPHLYISALAIYDGESKLLHRWKERFRGLTRLIGKRRREHLLTTLIKHNGEVTSVSFSHDDRYIVSASSDMTVRVWNAETGKEKLMLEGHTYDVNSASFSYDGRHIVSASYHDKTVRVWNAETGKEELMLEGHTNQVRSASFSHDDRYIVSASSDMTVRVWNAETGKEKLMLEGHTYDVNSASFSYDGRHIVSASYDKTVRVWNAETGKEELMLEGHTNGVNSASFSHDGQHIVSASSDKTVRVWNAETGKEELMLEGHTSLVLSASFSYDGRHIVSASYDKTVRVWNAETGKEELMLEGHTNYVNSASFSHNGQHIVSGSSDKTVQVWNAEIGKEELMLKGHTDFVSSALFSHDGQHIISASYDKTVRVWNAEIGMEKLMLEGHTAQVRSASFSHDGQHIVSASDDRTVRVWNAETGKEELMLEGHTSLVLSASFSHDGQHIVSASDDRTVRVWNAETGKEELMLEGHTSLVLSASFSYDGRHIVSASYDKTVRVWNAETGKEKLMLKGHTAQVRSASFSHDGQHIVSASYDKTVRVWNAETGKEELMLKGHTEGILSASFLHNGQHIVSAGIDNTVRVWNLEAGHSHPITSTSCDQPCLFYKTLAPASPQAWRVQQDGWLVSLHQERLLWLPSTLIPILRTPRCQLVISRLGDLTVDFSDACLSENWKECYMG
ncbi:WD40 repeat-like protein [Hymenopellis radicata]|nr:WD40 repeat-like protein [Hymenopellis radicata]